MLKIIIKEDEVIFNGHTSFEDFGKDIVCASASSIMYTSINAMELFNKKSVDLIKEDNKVTVKFLKQSEEVSKLRLNMINLLKGLQKDYPENIKIKEE